MEQKLLAAVCGKIYQRFPEMKGVAPKVQKYEGEQVLLLFKSAGKTADGKTIMRTVRVVATPEGKINKITTSR